MTRKVHRVPLRLDPGEVETLSAADLEAILRGADELIMRGGRSLLSQILKGSRRKRLLELGLDASPVFGHFRNLDEKQILARIDWAILNGYLAIEYDGRLPLLVYTDRGWEIEKNTYAEQLLHVFDEALTGGRGFDVEALKGKNREVIWLLLDKIQATEDSNYIPLLEAWRETASKKVKGRIRHVIRRLASPHDS